MSQLNLRKGFAFAAALLLVGAAVAIAVATHGSGASNASQLTHIAKGDPDMKGSLKDTPGEGANVDRAAQEAYEARAYPADEVPFQAQLNAQKAYMKVNAKFQAAVTASSIFGQLNPGGASVGKFTPGSWQSIGNGLQNYPATLTFFGKPYVDAGRTTAMAISPSCTQQTCRLWIGAAGGGVWRTTNALAPPLGQSWQFVSGSFGANTIGNLVYSNGVLYAGLGETHACGDCGAGMGLYKSTDNGQTWKQLPSITHTNNPGDGDYTGDAFAGRAISSVVVDPINPKSIWVGSGRAVRGVQATTAGATSNPPLPRPQFGLFHSLDGGQTFQLVWDGNGTIRGITRFALDPSNNQIMYASAYSQGLWRSINGGTTWTQIQAPLLPQATDNAVRTEFAVTTKNGLTRIYAQRGASGPDAGEPPSDVWRIDDASGAPVLTNITQPGISDNICGGQCWYDQIVTTPAGYPDMVYFGGSFDYGTYGFSTNGRGVILSTDAGASYTDMTADADEGTPPADSYAGAATGFTKSRNALHPDQHVLVTNPNNPNQFFEGNDGGVMRSDGTFTDISSECTTERHMGPISTARCQQLLSRVPTKLDSLNAGLNTLQFQSIWIDTTNPNHVQGGTQDNGTFESNGSNSPGPLQQILYGDGGNGGIQTGNPTARLGSFYGQLHDANVDNGDPTQWYIIGGPIYNSPESSLFYPPVLADPSPAAAQTIFEGSQSVWRTQDWGGNPAVLKASCPEFFSGANPTCGDFVKLGATTLTTSALGTRSGGNVDYFARAPQDTSTMWAATNAGRVFISKNVDANPASSVVFTRLDQLAANSPGRAISAIAVDPTNANHAYIVYNGYNFNTPAQPGHVFSVWYNPVGPSATWTSLDNNIGDLPATSVAYDAVKDDLYVSNDFGVMRLPHANAAWTMAGSGLPTVEVPDLKIMPGVRTLYAATHGLGLWKMPLPGN